MNERKLLRDYLAGKITVAKYIVELNRLFPLPDNVSDKLLRECKSIVEEEVRRVERTL
jgi:hypothetical protein